MSRRLGPAVRLRVAVPVLVTAVLAAALGAGTPAQAAPSGHRPPALPTLPARPDGPGTRPAAPTPDPQAAAEAAADASPTKTVSALVKANGRAQVVSVPATPAQVARVTAQLKSRPGVVAVDVDVPVWADAVDTYRDEQWGLDALNIDDVPRSTADDTGALVAVVDSGVLATHEDLAGRVRCDIGADFVDDPANSSGDGCTDPDGHGTHVSGEIAANANNGMGVEGVSNASILPVRVLNEEGWGSSASVAAGIIYAVDSGAKVINLSLGGAESDVDDAAVQYALDNDVVVVASAGNDRQEGNLPNFPAAYPGVMSVAASDADGLSAYYSSTNSNTFITAPGDLILSTSADGTYGVMSGTSMAAPYVAGVVSRYRALHPSDTVADVRAAVQATALDMERPGRDVNTGYGLIDALELLTGQDAPALPPVLTPGAPTVTQVLDGNNALAVRWAAPIFSGTSAITMYDLDVYRYSGGDWQYLDTTTVSGTTRYATITGLRNGYQHIVVLWPYNRYGYGQYAESPVVIPLPPTRPGAPGIGTASPANGAAVVRWTAAAPNRASIRSYTIRAYRGSSVVATVVAGGTATSAVVRGLINGAAHTFTVTATNSVGAGPASSASAPVWPRTVPTAPRILAPVPADSSATVRWAAPTSNGGATITGYTVRAYRGSTLVRQVTAAGNATSVSVTGLANGYGHWFVVYATNAAGNSPLSARSTTVVPAARPGAPTVGTATPGSGSAVFRWTAPTNTGGLPIRSYAIRISESGTVVKVVTASPSLRALTVTGLTNGSTYDFTVTASNALGWGAESAPGSVTLPV